MFTLLQQHHHFTPFLSPLLSTNSRPIFKKNLSLQIMYSKWRMKKLQCNKIILRRGKSYDTNLM